MTDTTDQLERQVSAFLIREAELLDKREFKEWHALFAEDGTYYMPLDPDDEDPQHTWMHVYDDALRLEERVFHATDMPYPSQSPPSRTLHYITNLRVTQESDGHVKARSNQLIGEIRVGDFRQTGLGNLRYLAAEVDHDLRVNGSDIRISNKTIRLLNRDALTGLINFLF